MKTVSFHDLRVGRSEKQVLLNLDTAKDQTTLSSGLHLIVAPNGYGKTSLLQTLAGVLLPLKGGIRLDGKAVQPDQDLLYISEYLSFPKFIYPTEWIDFIAGRYDEAELKPWIEGFRLPSKMKSYLGRMSQGERRKVTWLAALASKRPILLLDEPLDGLDLLAIHSARQMVEKWKSEDRVILIVAHQVGEMLDVCTEAHLIHDQKLLPWSKHSGSPARELGAQEFSKQVLKFYQG